MKVSESNLSKVGVEDRVKRVAILFASLEPAAAQVLLDRLTPDQARRIEQARTALPTLDRQEQIRVISAFMYANTATSLPHAPTQVEEVHLDESLARMFQVSDAPNSTAQDHEDRFGFLNDIPLDLLHKRLEQAEPAVVAIVIANLEPQRAAEFLALLSSQRQVDVLRNVTDLHATEQEILDRVARDLQVTLEEALQEQQKRKQGLAIVQSILQAAGQHRRVLLANLAQHGGEIFADVEAELRLQTAPESTPLGAFLPDRPELPAHAGERHRHPLPATKGAGNYSHPSDWQASSSTPVPLYHLLQIEPAGTLGLESAANQKNGTRMVQTECDSRGEELTWDDLILAEDAELARLLHEAEPSLLADALSGAHPMLLDRFCRQLPTREAQYLRRQVTLIRHPHEVCEAQTALLNMASRLWERGSLQPRETRRFAAAA